MLCLSIRLFTASLRLALDASSGLEKAAAKTATTNRLMMKDINRAIAGIRQGEDTSTVLRMEEAYKYHVMENIHSVCSYFDLRRIKSKN